MNKVYELLKTIENRPNLYLGEHSLQLLSTLIQGYLMGLREFGLEDETYKEAYKFSRDLQKYISKKYNDNRTVNWATILNELHETRDEAFSAFFRDLNDFVDKEYSLEEEC